MALVEEPAAIGIGTSGSTSTDDAERALFADGEARLLADRPALHAMLAMTGGSAWPAGAATILDAPYQSYLFDLIDGPDNWHLVRAVAGRPRHRLRRASRGQRRRPVARARVGGALRGVGSTLAASNAWAWPTAGPSTA